VNIARSKVVLALALLTAITSGCNSRYVITTTNGSKIITSRKPRLQESMYVFKDGYGRTNQIPAMRVRLIEPYSKEAAGSLPRTPELQ
jgi:hypothetical protein